LDREAFGRQYLRRVDGRISLVDKPNLDCVFWDGGCTVYDIRPRQCRTFPFWRENVASPKAWRKTETRCPGVGEGPLYDLGRIQKLAADRGDTE